MNESLELLVRDRIFTGWTMVRVTRDMSRMSSDFDIECSGKWPGQDQPIMPFDSVRIRLGSHVVFTGYVDVVAPNMDHRGRSVRVSGRSKTADLIDCTPQIRGSELRASRIDAVARALAAPFGIEVLSDTDVGAPLMSEAVLDPGETAFDAIERLCRVRSVFATDTEEGALLITRAGTKRSPDRLEEGRNILSGKVELNASKRFSRYIVQSQKQLAAASHQGGDGDTDDDDVTERENAGVVVNVDGTADDPEVPRNRPRILSGETAMNAAQARARALWAATTARAKALTGSLLVQGWFQSDGKPWQINTIIPVSCPYLRIEGDMLISGVSFNLDPRMGRTTELTVGPPEAWTPEPAKVSKPTVRSSSGSSTGMWNGIGRAIR